MSSRKLPQRRNPHLGPITDDEYRSDLIGKRRLGQTELAVDPGQVGTSNATKPKNLGSFDYAHLRIPLPKDLKGSGIFHVSRGHNTPEAYFLMRRSSDGYISATGMFKVAFPWATHAEELAEKEHLKTVEGAGREEIAGNIWISPVTALELADEYNMRDWVIILLDPTEMAKGNHDPAKDIKSPPYFEVPSEEPAATEEQPIIEVEEEEVQEVVNSTPSPPPTIEPKATRLRSLRSASPSKAMPPTTPGRKIATPRRTKRGRPAASSMLAPTAEEDDHAAKAASASAEPESIFNGDTIKVDIEKTVSPTADGEEATTTHVTVETPADHPQLSLPDDAQAYLEQANRALIEANKLTASRATGRKRKAREMEIEDAALTSSFGGESSASAANGTTDMIVNDDELEIRPSKRIRHVEIELKKERAKRRAMLGVAGSLAFGAILPVIVGTFFQSI